MNPVLPPPLPSAREPTDEGPVEGAEDGKGGRGAPRVDEAPTGLEVLFVQCSSSVD